MLSIPLTGSIWLPLAWRVLIIHQTSGNRAVFGETCSRIACEFAEASPERRQELILQFGDFSLGRDEMAIILKSRNRPVRTPLLFEETARKAKDLEGVSETVRSAIADFFHAKAIGLEEPEVLGVLHANPAEAKLALAALMQFASQKSSFHIPRQPDTSDVGHGLALFSCDGPARLFSQFLETEEGARHISISARIGLVEDQQKDWHELFLNRGFSFFKYTDLNHYLRCIGSGQAVLHDLPPRNTWTELKGADKTAFESLFMGNDRDSESFGLFNNSDNAITEVLQTGRWPDVWLIDIEQENSMNGIQLARYLREVALFEGRQPILVIYSSNISKYQAELDQMVEDGIIDFYFDKSSWEKADEIVGRLDELLIERAKSPKHAWQRLRDGYFESLESLDNPAVIRRMAQVEDLAAGGVRKVKTAEEALRALKPWIEDVETAAGRATGIEISARPWREARSAYGVAELTGDAMLSSIQIDLARRALMAAARMSDIDIQKFGQLMKFVIQFMNSCRKNSVVPAGGGTNAIEFLVNGLAEGRPEADAEDHDPGILYHEAIAEIAQLAAKGVHPDAVLNSDQKEAVERRLFSIAGECRDLNMCSVYALSIAEYINECPVRFQALKNE